MQTLDWLIVVLPILLVVGIGWYTHRYMKGVAGFVSGNRSGGRYLMAVARGELQAGAVVFVAYWEVFRQAGFVQYWWAWMTVPISLIVSVSGFVIYRFRETRAMTLAQFFEMRYTRKIRLFTGLLSFAAGFLNFGIIPAVGARFIVHLTHLPPELQWGDWVIPTFIPLMGFFLLISTALTVLGGFVTLMVTDCVEGMLSHFLYLVIIVGLFTVIGWSQIESVIGSRPSGFSMVNPFDAWQVQDFNFWYALMWISVTVYGTMAWQNSSAYNSAAFSPHESRMAGILGRWRESGKMVVVSLLGAAGVAFIAHPDFAAAAAPAHQALAEIGNPQLQKQMEVPISLSYLLPVGIKGALCVVLIMGIFGGDSTQLHSWGGILAQDIVLPLLKKAPSPKQHVRLLRASTILVAAGAFLFGALVTQTEYIAMWFQISTAVYVGGAGAAIIGGLYWRKGTAAGAWAAMITGAVLSSGGILATKIVGPTFPLNGIQVSFFATLVAIAVYVTVSLLTCRQEFDLEAMLHRDPQRPDRPRAKLTWARLVGFDENFTRGDRWIAGSIFAWGMMWFAVFVIGTIWNLLRPWPLQAWTSFWHIGLVILPAIISLITGIWFTWGGLRDIRHLFRSLRAAAVDVNDNGTVPPARPRDAPPEPSVRPAVKPESHASL